MFTWVSLLAGVRFLPRSGLRLHCSRHHFVLAGDRSTQLRPSYLSAQLVVNYTLTVMFDRQSAMSSRGWQDVDHGHLLQKGMLLQLLNSTPEKPSELNISEQSGPENSLPKRVLGLQRE